MEFSSVLSSNSNHSIEEFEMDDCYNNLVPVDDVTVEETEGGVPEFVEEGDVEDVSMHTVDYEDFAVGVAQHEATARIVNVPFNDSGLFDRISDTGRAFVMVKEEVNHVDDYPPSNYSLAQSELISPSELFRIEECNARYEANIATCEYIDFLKEEEVKRLGDVALPQVNPTSEASSELVLTPLQAFQVKIINDAYRLRNEEKENQAAEALFLAQQELSVTQCTGYGALQGHFVVNRVIEGLLPKINSIQLTQNWLLNKENIFENIPF